tara:strand:+ start:398 stop:790 length:393 start_codon:yes stop_codon:yes gene_type:complete
MAVYNYKSGLGNSAAYQVSGVPYVTGALDATTPTVIKFPRVTSWVTLGNFGSNNLVFGFSEIGVSGDRAFAVPSGSTSPVYDLKVTEIWLSGSDVVTVMAGLTSIDTESINNLSISPSGTNWSGSAIAKV